MPARLALPPDPWLGIFRALSIRRKFLWIRRRRVFHLNRCIEEVVSINQVPHGHAGFQDPDRCLIDAIFRRGVAVSFDEDSGFVAIGDGISVDLVRIAHQINGRFTDAADVSETRTSLDHKTSTGRLLQRCAGDDKDSVIPHESNSTGA